MSDKRRDRILEILTDMAESTVTDNKWYDDTFHGYWDMVEDYEN
eukprot:CAMPEP_0114596358 /NCGR_PEP_ID=MMETSP0125-20121206/18343_1 /TAXON_ID=485358 ORGANISM="Aristerostoma sp., Strain ATCC 50986" /NCGR_SAMPLE_ID=MMETSP0125 /ASSEMBLY_ACC=CAM_ASM_000245 /LENGTH=43 /DNA_ID= /DNA_START= /DNA_END= /DNA_ORIENTATION=